MTREFPLFWTEFWVRFRKPAFSAVFLALSAVIGFTPCSSAQTDLFSPLTEGASAPNQNPAGRAVDLLEAFTLHGESWQSGDLLVRMRYTFDSVRTARGELDLQGALVEQTVYSRIAFDFPSNRYCAMQYANRSALDLRLQGDKGKDPQASSEVLTGGCVNSAGLAMTRRFPEQRLEYGPDYQVHLRKTAAAMIAFPDYRVLGIVNSPQIAGSQARPVARVIADRATLWQFRGLEYKGGFVTFAFSRDFDQGPIAKSTESWRFDETRLVPVERQVESLLRDADSPEGSNVIRKTVMEWRELGGVQLILSLRSENPSGVYQVPSGHLSGVENIEFDFHWFRFNEPIDEGMFNGTALSSVDAFLKLVDPARCGATGLLMPGQLPIEPSNVAMKKPKVTR